MEWIWKAISIAIVSYVVLCVVLYFKQPGLVFYPELPGRDLIATPKHIHLDYEDVEFITEDYVRLHGWFVPAKNNVDAKTVLFFHGNAGNVSHRLDSIRIFNELGLNVFIFDYRGYGLSEGTITESGSYTDAKAAWSYLVNVRQTEADRIVLFGRSLGAAIASWLASQYSPSALIIESGFSSVESMAKQLYPFLPVRLLNRFSYNTKKYLESVNCAVLVVHSGDDEIIPYEQGLDLFKAIKQDKSFLRISGGHNDGFLTSGEVYTKGLESFLKHIENK